MATGVRLYKSTDTSAPVLTGQVGSLTNLLTACLVNGYGTKPAAGWSVAFTGTNQTTFLQAVKTNFNSYFLHVDDNATGIGGAKEARIRSTETATAFNVGTQQMPTTFQISSGAVNWRKSNTADGTARAWYVLADGRTVYLFVMTGDIVIAPFEYYTGAYGDFFSYVPGDMYNVFLAGRPENDNGGFNDGLIQLANSVTTTSAGNFVDRPFSGMGGSINVGKHFDAAKFGGVGQWSVAYPNPADGRLLTSPIWIHETAQPTIRGYLRGMWIPLHAPSNYNDGDTFTGTSGSTLSGRAFAMAPVHITLYFGGGPTNQAGGMWAMETSDTWDTN